MDLGSATDGSGAGRASAHGHRAHIPPRRIPGDTHARDTGSGHMRAHMQGGAPAGMACACGGGCGPGRGEGPPTSPSEASSLSAAAAAGPAVDSARSASARSQASEPQISDIDLPVPAWVHGGRAFWGQRRAGGGGGQHGAHSRPIWGRLRCAVRGTAREGTGHSKAGRGEWRPSGGAECLECRVVFAQVATSVAGMVAW